MGDQELLAIGWFGLVILILWYVITIIQSFLAYGTAYRKTKKGADDGIALFGWMIVYGLAATVPFLGYYLWKKSKE